MRSSGSISEYRDDSAREGMEDQGNYATVWKFPKHEPAHLCYQQHKELQVKPHQNLNLLGKAKKSPLYSLDFGYRFECGSYL